MGYREIVEGIVGRPLRSDEIVHHINGDHWDDRPENLMVVTAKEHAAIHAEEHRAALERARVRRLGAGPRRCPVLRGPSALDLSRVPSLIDAVFLWSLDGEAG